MKDGENKPTWHSSCPHQYKAAPLSSNYKQAIKKDQKKTSMNMMIEQIFQDKTIKAKGKVSIIGEWLTNNELPIEELLVYAGKQKATDQATCIEAVEYATKKLPTIASESLLNYVTKALKDNELRVKWESAKVIGNIAKLFPTQLDKVINNLLSNAENKGTVVRWATAYALAEILKLNTENNNKLLPKIEILCEKEEDNGVKKKYLDALKKVKKYATKKPCQANGLANQEMLNSGLG